MKYMGSKNRIAKYIIPLMEAERKPGQWWVEPFVGGANSIDKVQGKRLGSDSNRYLIALLNKMKERDFEAPLVGEDLYDKIKEDPTKYEDWLVGYAGTQLSYGAMWFSTYRRDRKGERDYALEAKRNVDKQSKKIKNIFFKLSSYRNLVIPEESLIYCDPPYANTAEYKAVSSFDSIKFWQWCREKSKEGHTIFVSEYSAPDDFECVWQKEIVSSLTKNTGSKKGVEKLFRYGGNA